MWAQGGNTMLFWESLHNANGRKAAGVVVENRFPIRTQRLPFDTRCSALTKSGTRCRGRIHREGEFCVFHDPEMTAKRREAMAEKRVKTRRRLSHIPDGYLRKLTSRAAIGNAMDRLYREVRLGSVSIEMGTVLFGILNRLLDSELIPASPCPQRSKAARVQPKLEKLLNQKERSALKRAVENDTLRTEGPRNDPQRHAAFDRAVAQRRSARAMDDAPSVRAVPTT
jgi:hypothetical protein